MACPHLFPKQDNLYPETGYFVSVFGNKISCFGIQSCRFRIQSFRFRIQIILFRKQVWTGHKAPRHFKSVWGEIWRDCSSRNRTTEFPYGDHDVISRRKVLPPGECTHSVCWARMQQRPAVPDPQYIRTCPYTVQPNTINIRPEFSAGFSLNCQQIQTEYSVPPYPN